MKLNGVQQYGMLPQTIIQTEKNAWKELVNIFINKEEPLDDENKKQFGKYSLEF
jgi:hypothetical protein